MTTRTTQVRLERATVLALRKRASELGFVQARGALAGEGDTAAMLEAVARGQIGIGQLEKPRCYSCQRCPMCLELRK